MWWKRSVLKAIVSLLALFPVLLACQPGEVSTPSETATQHLQAATLISPSPIAETPIVTLTAKVLPTLTTTNTPQQDETTPVERLWFSVAAGGAVSRPDWVIAFANSDGTGLEMPTLFEPYRSIGNAGRNLAWSADGRYLAFDGANETYSCNIPVGTDCFKTNYGISIADMENSLITNHLEGTLTNPSWSPYSQYIVISRKDLQADPKNLESGTGYLFRYDIKTRQSQQLTSGTLSDIYPAWSPDGNWIAFLRYTSDLPRCGPVPSLILDCNHASLYLIHPDGTGLKLLIDDVRIEAGDGGDHLPYNAPVWSPDGNWLAVLVGNEQSDIALVNVDNNEVKLLVVNEAKDYYPAWSPDGSTLAFVSNREGNHEIYLISADGTNLVNLTQNTVNDFAPVWSPSGRYIAFLSDYKLFVMNADGSELAEIMGKYIFAVGRPTWLSVP